MDKRPIGVFFPFGRIAFAMADSPVLPFAAYGGSIGVGLLVALSGGCLAELVAQARRRALVPGLAAAAAAGTLLLSPLVLPVESAPQDGAVRVAAVQGNVAENFEYAFEHTHVILVPVCDNKTSDFFKVLLEVCEVRYYDVDIKHLILREREAAIDNQYVILVLNKRNILAYLLEPA